jgi:hypothetical protein
VTAVSRHHDPSSTITQTSFTTSSSSFVSKASRAEMTTTAASKPHPSSVDGNKNSADPDSSYDSNSRKKRQLDSFIETSEPNTEKPSSLAGYGTAEEGDGTISTNMNESEQLLHDESEKLNHREEPPETRNNADQNTNIRAGSSAQQVVAKVAVGGGNEMITASGVECTISRLPMPASRDHRRSDETKDQGQNLMENEQLSPRSKTRQQWLDLLEERQTRVRDRDRLHDWWTRVLTFSDPNSTDFSKANNSAN